MEQKSPWIGPFPISFCPFSGKSTLPETNCQTIFLTWLFPFSPRILTVGSAGKRHPCLSSASLLNPWSKQGFLPNVLRTSTLGRSIPSLGFPGRGSEDSEVREKHPAHGWRDYSLSLYIFSDLGLLLGFQPHLSVWSDSGYIISPDISSDLSFQLVGKIVLHSFVQLEIQGSRKKIG